MSNDQLSAHLRVARYGDFTLTDAIRPAFLLIAIFPVIAAVALLRFRFETNGVAMALTELDLSHETKDKADV